MKKLIKYVLAIPLLSVVLFGYQNCSKLSFKMEDEGYRRAGLLEDENGRPIPYYQSFAIGAESIQYPDLKMVFVLDNSKSMEANRINFSAAFKNLFNNENKEILKPFNTTIFITTTAQLSMTDISKLNQLPSRSPASLVNSNFGDLQKERSPVVTGALPGDIFGLYHLSGVDSLTGIEKHSFLPASLVGISADNSGKAKILMSLTKAPYQDPAQMIQDFESRVALLQWNDGSWNSSNQDAKAQVVDNESGLCAVSRIMRHPDEFMQQGDLLSIAIFSDEDDKNSTGSGNESACIDSIHVAPVNQQLTTVNCKRDATKITFDQYKSDCQINYNTPSKCILSYDQTTTSAPSCNVSYKSIIKSSCPVSYKTIATSAKCIVSYRDSFKFTLYGNKITTDITVPASVINDGYFGLSLTNGNLTSVSTKTQAGRVGDCKSQIISLVEANGNGARLSSSDLATIDKNLTTGVLKCAVKAVAFQTASTTFGFVEYADVNYTSNVTTSARAVCSNASKLMTKIGTLSSDIELSGECSIDSVNLVSNKDLVLANSKYSDQTTCSNYFSNNAFLAHSTQPTYSAQVLSSSIVASADGLASSADCVVGNKSTILTVLRNTGKLSGSITDAKVYDFTVNQAGFKAAAYDVNTLKTSNQAITDGAGCTNLTDTTKLPSLKSSVCTIAGDSNCLVSGSVVAAKTTTKTGLASTYFGLDQNSCVNKSSASISTLCNAAGVSCGAASYTAGSSGSATIAVNDQNSCNKANITNFKNTYCAGDTSTAAGSCYATATTNFILKGSTILSQGVVSNAYPGTFDCSSSCASAGGFCKISSGIFAGTVNQYLESSGRSCVTATHLQESQSPAETPVLSSSVPANLNDYACLKKADGFIAVDKTDAGSKTGNPSVDYVYVTEDLNGQPMSFTDYFYEKSQDMFGQSLHPIVNVFTLDATFGDQINPNGQSSYGVNYQKFADKLQGSKYSVVRSDYGLALKNLGTVIQQKLARSAKIALKDPNKQQIRRVWLTRAGQEEVELDSTEWGAAGSSLTINENVTISLGDQVRVEFW